MVPAAVRPREPPLHRDLPADSAAARLRAAWERERYAVLRHVIPRTLVDAVLSAFHTEVVPYRGNLLRHDAEPAPHRFSSDGRVLNALLDPHRIEVPALAGFAAAMRQLVAAREVTACLSILDGETSYKVDQVILFFVCPGSGPHFDGFPVDTWPRGRAYTLWMPLEAVMADAGPPYVVPYSKLAPEEPNFAADSPIWRAEHHVNAARRLLSEQFEERITTLGLPRIPLLGNPGDLLVWSSQTVHGSTVPRDRERSRMSVQVLVRPADAACAPYFGAL